MALNFNTGRAVPMPGNGQTNTGPPAARSQRPNGVSLHAGVARQAKQRAGEGLEVRRDLMESRLRRFASG